jgi:hypothetical protein
MSKRLHEVKERASLVETDESLHELRAPDRKVKILEAQILRSNAEHLAKHLLNFETVQILRLRRRMHSEICCGQSNYFQRRIGQ